MKMIIKKLLPLFLGLVLLVPQASFSKENADFNTPESVATNPQVLETLIANIQTTYDTTNSSRTICFNLPENWSSVRAKVTYTVYTWGGKIPGSSTYTHEVNLTTLYHADCVTIPTSHTVTFQDIQIVDEQGNTIILDDLNQDYLEDPCLQRFISMLYSTFITQSGDPLVKVHIYDHGDKVNYYLNGIIGEFDGLSISRYLTNGDRYLTFDAQTWNIIKLKYLIVCGGGNEDEIIDDLGPICNWPSIDPLSIDCVINGNDINVTITGGQEPYSVEYEDDRFFAVNGAATISDLSCGEYGITVTDAIGCSVECSSIISSSTTLEQTICAGMPFMINAWSDCMEDFNLEDICYNWEPSELLSTTNEASAELLPINEAPSQHTVELTVTNSLDGSIIHQVTVIVSVEDCDDTDGDGIADEDDPCSTSVDNGDLDGDGIANGCDNCPQHYNPSQENMDGDELGDACDADVDDDSDGDGLPDYIDPCPFSQFNGDTDGDGIPDCIDNCDDTPNTTQADTDGDGIGDVCDDVDNDSDGDGDGDDHDPCPLDPDNLDSDGDGICDAQDDCPYSFNPFGEDVDFDNDGVCDGVDNCPLEYNPDQADIDGDGQGDICDPINDDPDTDGDGTPDSEEDPNNDADGDGVPDPEDGDDDDPCNVLSLELDPAGAVFCGDPITISVIPEPDHRTYNWHTGEQTNSITVNATGNYFVTVTYENGCVVEDVVEVVSQFNNEGIKDVLFENGYSEIFGTYSPVGLKNESSSATKSSSQPESFGLVAGSSFIYEGQEFIVDDIVSEIYNIMFTDEYADMQGMSSMYGDQFCGAGDVSFEEFIDASNNGSNVSVFMLPNSMMVKVRSNGEDRAVNILEVKKLMDDFAQYGDSFYDYVTVLELFEMDDASNIGYANLYAGLILELMELLGYSYHDAREKIIDYYNFFKECALGIINNDNPGEIIPQGCWEYPPGYWWQFFSGMVNELWAETYGLLQLSQIVDAYKSPWCYSLGSWQYSTKLGKLLRCPEKREIRNTVNATIDQIVTYYKDKNLVEEFLVWYVKWVDYLRNNPGNVSWHDIIFNCDSPISENRRKKLYCFDYDFYDLDNYPVTAPTCINFLAEDTDKKCAYDKGRSTVQIVTLIGGAISGIKQAYKSGKFATAKAQLAHKVDDILKDLEDVLKFVPEEHKGLFVADFKDRPDMLTLFKKNPEWIQAWEDLFEFPNLRINPKHLEAYDVFKATNNVTPKVTKDEIIEALNDLGSEADQAFYLNHLDEFNKGNRAWGHVDYEGGDFQGHLADHFRVRVANQSTRENVGVAFMENNILEFHLLIPPSLQQQKLGTTIFKRSITEFNPSKVKGNWLTNNVYNGGESINLTIFKQKLTEGFSPQAAAFETPTGKILKQNGFGGTPTIITNTTDEVVVHFNPG